jgi:hypothetical protein
MAAIMSFTFIPTQIQAAETKAITTTLVTTQEAQASALLSRLNEIKMMDKASLSPAEKTELRKEVRFIREHLKDVSGGVYISAGALILILILLIILT